MNFMWDVMEKSKSMNKRLAINGGRKTIEYKFNKYFSHDEHELNAAIEVIKSKQLSGFAAEEGAEFHGGSKSQGV